MEVFDLYDKEGNQLDKTMIRGTSNKKGEYHLVVHIWVRNSKGEYLIQQRNKLSDKVPYLWAMTGGAVTSGEDSVTGAKRELLEELGLNIPKEDFKLIRRDYIDAKEGCGFTTNYITDIYLVESDVAIDSLVFDYNEVKDAKYVSKTELLRMNKDKELWMNERYLEDQGFLTLLEKS